MFQTLLPCASILTVQPLRAFEIKAIRRAGVHKQTLRRSDGDLLYPQAADFFLLKDDFMHVSNIHRHRQHSLSQIRLRRHQAAMNLPPLVSLTKFSYFSLLEVTGAYVVTRARKPLGFPMLSMSSIKLSSHSRVGLPWMTQPQLIPLAASSFLK